LTTQTGDASSIIYYAPNIAAGANTITITFSASTPCTDVRAAEYSGILTASPFDVQSSATSTTGTALSSSTATTTAASELLVGSLYVFSTPTAGAGWTNRVTSGGGNILEDQIVNSTGTYAATGTQSSSGWWIAQMATFKAATQANTFTINSALAYPNGSTIDFQNGAASGSLSIAITGGATLYLKGQSPTVSGTRSILPSGEGVATLWPDGNWYIGGPGTN
jgi:hypothetical protein